jgi:hypothetical protein
MVVERVLAVAHHDDAADHLALAVEFRDAAAHLRPARTSATSRNSTGVPSFVAVSGMRAGPRALHVARDAHHVLGLGHLEHRAARLLVAALGSPARPSSA